MDQTETKILNLNSTPTPQIPTTLQVFRNQSNQSPEQLGNLTSHYSNVRTGQIKTHFQNTRTPDSDGSQTSHLGRKSSRTTIMKSL